MMKQLLHNNTCDIEDKNDNNLRSMTNFTRDWDSRLLLDETHNEYNLSNANQRKSLVMTSKYIQNLSNTEI